MKSKSYMPQSKSDTHITPDRVFEIIYKKYKKKKEQLFDPCPVDHDFNGLEIKWKKWNFVNPPYGKEQEGKRTTLLELFVDKAIRETSYGRNSIMLLPSKTDQEWFHRIIANNYEITWIRKRLKFKNNKDTSTQPHFIVLISNELRNRK